MRTMAVPRKEGCNGTLPRAEKMGFRTREQQYNENRDGAIAT